MDQLQTRVVFTGDIAFSDFYAEGWKGEGCAAPAVKDYLHGADFVAADVEGPLTDGDYESSRKLKHCSPTASGAYLRALNIKIWHLANNHIMDCGADGLRDTLRSAVQNGCTPIGAGENLEEASRGLTVGDAVRVALLPAVVPLEHIKAEADCPGALTWDRTELIRARITELREQADWVVVIAHGGDEYCDLALPYMRSRYQKLLELGADIVVAHHPHVVQNYERIGNKMIFYSLGNFIFDTETQRTYRHTDCGVLLGIDFMKESFAFDHLPIRINRETNLVEPGETPASFCEVEETEYEKLWPLQAKVFYPVDRRKRLTQNRRWAEMPKLLFQLRELYACRKTRERTIQKGRLLARSGKWETSEMKELQAYLCGE